MIVRNGTLWAIAALVLFVSVSFSETVKLRKPRKRTTMKTPYQQSRIGPVIIKVMHKYNDDSLTRSVSGGCTSGNCRNAHDKFHLDINEAISDEDNFLSDEESLRYVVHPEKYEHFVLRKNTGHANKYKRASAFSETRSSHASDHTVLDRDGDVSKVSKNENKENLIRVPLYRINNTRDFSKHLSEASEVSGNEKKENLTRVPLYRVDRNKRDLSKHSSKASEVSENKNKGNLTRVPLYRIDKSKRDTSKYSSEANKISENKNKGNLTKVPLYKIDKSKRDISKHSSEERKVSENKNNANITRVPLYRIDKSKRDISKHSSEERKISENKNNVNLTRVPLYRIDKSKRDTSKYSSEANKISENKNKGNLTRVPLYRIDKSKRDISKHSSEERKVSENKNNVNLTRVPLYRIEKSKRDLSEHSSEISKVLETKNKANLTRVPLYKIDRSKRDLSKHSSETNKVLKPENKGNLTRIPLYRTDYNTWDRPKHLSDKDKRDLAKSLGEASRPIRNDSDYYAQRKAVMERYYARQREINARYANRTSAIPRLEHNDVSQNRLTTNNATLFNLGRVYPSKESAARDSATFRHSSARIDPIYSNESRYNKVPIELDSRRNVALENGLGFKSDADLSQTRSSGNIERNALDYFVTPTPCTNLSLSGTLAPKTRLKHAKNSTRETGLDDEDCNHNSTDNDNVRGNLRWGRCEGKIVYQHNLLLGLTGPSNLDALFEVIIQGPVCITCVEALRYNETRATVRLDSGGRGHEYAKLRLQGYENEGFSYIIKVWGVNKTGQTCDNVD